MTTPAIIDAVALAVLAGFTLAGVWRGLLRSLAGLLVIVISLTGARMIASNLTKPAAELLAPAVEKRIEARLNKALEEARPGEMPEGLALSDLLDLLGFGENHALLERAQEAVRDTGASIAAAVVESAAESVLYSLLYGLSFLVLSAVLHLAVRAMHQILKLPGLHGLNALGGGLLGLLEGALLLFLAAWILKLLGVTSAADSRVFQFFTGAASWLPVV